ncbi:MAG: T9SS type A sorting domain-containing protein [Flavobacteriales bacterium]|jgi:hypothetical protein|nr:T9SS type A sorting domain-containing protein [Flavobacteriales bacterium]
MRPLSASALSLPILLAALAAGRAQAQPQLEHAHMQVIGLTFPIHLVAQPGTSDPSPDGADVTWDFSSLTLTMNVGSTTFMAPAGTPYAASHPTSNLAQAIVTPSGTTYNYFNLQPGQLDVLAEGVGGASPTVYTDPKTPFQFPFAYPDWFIDYYAYGGTNYSVSRAVMGYGTVILPTGTYTNVLKVASTSGTIDFVRTDPFGLLVHISSGGEGQVFGDPVMGVGDAALPPLGAWPNPATDAVRISGLRGTGTWELLDPQGRAQLSGRHAPGTLSVDISALASGPYLLVVGDDLGRRSVRVVRE